MIKETIFNTQISTGTYNEFVNNIIALLAIKQSSYVCFANVHMLTQCYYDKNYSKIINEADIVAPDGKPIAVLLNMIKQSKQEKVSGPDIFPDLLKKAAECDKRVFFYGSTERVLRKLISRALTDFPDLQISGYYAPPFRELSSLERDQIITRINKTSPDIVFVALGCPKQEKWMAAHVDKIKACMLGVGQAFQLYAGEINRAPRWMQHSGLEWAYRLYTEPRRLWKRYLYTNTLFVFITMRYLFSSKIKYGAIRSVKQSNP